MFVLLCVLFEEYWLTYHPTVIIQSVIIMSSISRHVLLFQKVLDILQVSAGLENGPFAGFSSTPGWDQDTEEHQDSAH